jgi:hypothetical protein
VRRRLALVGVPLLTGFGGAALGSLAGHLAPARFGAVGRAVASLVVAWLILAPPVLVAQSGVRVGAASPLEVAAGFFIPSAAVGAGLGWVAGGSPGAAGRGVLTAVLLLIGPGHNIPFLAGTPAVGRELAILALVLAAATLAMVLTEQVAMVRLGRQSAGESTL